MYSNFKTPSKGKMLKQDSKRNVVCMQGMQRIEGCGPRTDDQGARTGLRTADQGSRMLDESKPWMTKNFHRSVKYKYFEVYEIL